MREVFKGQPNVEVDTFDGLLVDYVATRKADVIVRGLRALSDFETEFQMALMNRRLSPHIETVFMMPAEQYTYISSRLIKEVFSLGGQVRGLVPEIVETPAAREAEREQRMLAERMSRVSTSPTMKVAGEAAETEAPGRRRRRLRRGRARFSDAAAGEGRGEGRDRPELHEVHAAGRHRRPEAGDLRPLQGRLRRQLLRSRSASSRRAASRRSTTPRWCCSTPATR